ncbi:MAG TPA: helix-turn-helix domain-containing protein [Propionibacteriaceae bacterium]|nr:helix-turn-helix domain-containing protein [Propionibacteriaceae bacterium]HPZ50706.1 helix-turn-helix domain-containing protein [Propionibacteriaceae bacterium]HQE32372.1 helix-turn-helix domain-containing protein [Propionibacteriaceae bacterium]
MAKASAAPTRTSGRTLVPSGRSRAAMVKRLKAGSAAMTTATLAEMDRHEWFRELAAEHRSWISLVARSGVDHFIEWLADEKDEPVSPTALFDAAPREVMRHITLQQTVELVRTTVEVVEQYLQTMPRGDRSVLTQALLYFSREVAFGAAELYAQAAEIRGAWDARLESLVVDAVVRGEADESLVSRASTLGWRSSHAVVVAVGDAPTSNTTLDALRRAAVKAGLDTLVATQGDRLVVVLSGEALVDDIAAAAVVGGLAPHFGPGPVVVGPVVDHLVDAGLSARAAFSGIRAAIAWPQAPRPVTAADLLPERALAGDGHARRALAQEVYRPLAASPDLLATLVGFVDAGSSIEAAARALYIHPNTVRYRLKRIHEISGYSPVDARDAYVLRLALTVGRLMA